MKTQKIIREDKTFNFSLVLQGHFKDNFKHHYLISFLQFFFYLTLTMAYKGHMFSMSNWQSRSTIKIIVIYLNMCFLFSNIPMLHASSGRYSLNVAVSALDRECAVIWNFIMLSCMIPSYRQLQLQKKYLSMIENGKSSAKREKNRQPT